METKRLEKTRQRLSSKISLIGGWLRRSAAKSLARDATPESVRTLAQTVATNPDGEVCFVALQELRKLESPDCIDAVCSIWAGTRHHELTRLLVEQRLVASRPPETRVLSALKTGQAELVAEGGANIVEPLVKACNDSDAEIAERARQTAGTLKMPGAIDRFYSMWAEARDAFLEQTILDAGYVASKPVTTRVLTALKLGRREAITGLGPNVLSPLVAACQDKDRGIAEQAQQAIGELTDSATRAALAEQICVQWAQSRSPYLEKIVVEGKYVASEPLDARVLSALKTGQRQLLQAAGAEIVEPLALACEDPDAEIAQQAKLALRHLTDPCAKDAVCQFAIEKEHPAATEAALAGKFAPQDEHAQASFFFLTEQWDRYDALDFDRRLLRAVYESANAALRQRITVRLRAAGRTDLLTVVVGSDFRSRAAVMTPDEMQFLVHMLSTNQEWARLWALVFELTLECAVSIVQLLAQNGWKPDADDQRGTFEELAALASDAIVSSSEKASEVLPPSVECARARISGRVNDVAFSPAHPVIAIGTGQRKVGLWNFQQAAMESVLGEFEHSIGRVGFLPGGGLLCAERTNSNAPCHVYSWCDGKRIRLGTHAGSVTALEPVDDSRALSVARDHQAILWDAVEGRKLGEAKFGFWARAARATADGHHVALLHKKVTLVSLPQMEVLAETARNYGGGISCSVAFSPDATELIFGKFNGKVMVCERQGARLIAERGVLVMHQGQVQGVEVLPKRSVVITAGSEGTIKFISWPNRSVIGSVKVAGERLTSLHVSPNGDFMAVGDSDSAMSLWDLRVMDVPLAVFARPFVQAAPSHMAAVEAVASNSKLPPALLRALQFIRCVLRHRFRHAIEIEEVQSIRAGEFDIEIEA